MPHVETDGNCIIVRTQYRDRDLIASIPGASYDSSDTHAWKMPLSWVSCVTLRTTFSDRLTFDQSIIDWTAKYYPLAIQPAINLRNRIDAPGHEKLYPFQRAGVQFLSHDGSLVASGQLPFIGRLLTDDMGLGKTVQSIHTLVECMRAGINPFPALVVCPNNMKVPWELHLKEWWPALQVGILDGTRPSRIKIINRVLSGQIHVLIANWESLRGHSRLAPFGSIKLKRCTECDETLRADPETARKNKPQNCEWCRRELNNITWRTIIADELHRAKDPSSKQTRALWALRTDETQLRLGLTGTPIEKSPVDLWSGLHFIDPESWPSRRKYVDLWCLTSYSPFGGYSVVGLKPERKESFFKIVDPYIRRIPKQLVLPQLPEKIYSIRYSPMHPKQAAAYEAMSKEMVAHLDESRLVAIDTLTQRIRLAQFASAFCDVEYITVIDKNTGLPEQKIKVRLTEPSNKIDTLMEILTELDQDPVLVFAESRQLIELAAVRLDKYKIKYSKIVGGQNAYERQAQVDEFQQGRARVCLIVTRAGREGLSLTRAGTAIFLQQSTSLINKEQAENRIHRIGSELHDKILIIYIIAPDTIEVEHQEMVLVKNGRAQEIYRDQELIDQYEQQLTEIGLDI